MAVYIDAVCNDGTYKLFADTMLELHSFAQALMLPISSFMDCIVPHYKIASSLRLKLIQNGAIPLTKQQTLAKWNELGYIDPNIKRLPALFQRTSFQYLSRLAPKTLPGVEDDSVLLVLAEATEPHVILLSNDEMKKLVEAWKNLMDLRER